jgi:hypothetical protein
MPQTEESLQVSTRRQTLCGLSRPLPSAGKRCPSFSNEAIAKELSSYYSVEEIESVFEHLTSLEEAGLLLLTETEAICPTDRTKYK